MEKAEDDFSSTLTSPRGLESSLKTINCNIQELSTMQPEDSAVARTFAIPELLENIFAELPQRDMLLAQRVSRTFNATINGSPLLRKLLFFEPPTDPLDDNAVECFRKDFICDDDPNYTGPKPKAPQNKPII